MGKSTISMLIFNSSVKLPEGTRIRSNKNVLSSRPALAGSSSGRLKIFDASDRWRLVRGVWRLLNAKALWYQLVPSTPIPAVTVVHGWNNKPTGIFEFAKLRDGFLCGLYIWLGSLPTNNPSWFYPTSYVCTGIYIYIYMLALNHNKRMKKDVIKKAWSYYISSTSQYIEAKKISTHHQVVTCLAAQLLPREDVGAARICHDCRETHPGSCAEQSTQLEVKDLSHHWLPLLISHIFGAGARHRFVANRICFINQLNIYIYNMYNKWNVPI